jgi:hypothetical protein
MLNGFRLLPAPFHWYCINRQGTVCHTQTLATVTHVQARGTTSREAYVNLFPLGELRSKRVSIRKALEMVFPT